MYLSFLIPLILGVVVKLLLIKTSVRIPVISDNLYNAFINTLTVGSLFNGVLIIYGTTNNLLYIYWIISALLILLSILFFLTKDFF